MNQDAKSPSLTRNLVSQAGLIIIIVALSAIPLMLITNGGAG